jgi:hypothetical protein
LFDGDLATRVIEYRRAFDFGLCGGGDAAEQQWQ